MVNWFPLYRSMMEGEDFRVLTPTEKLFFILILSEFNLRGEFYKSDLETSVTLGVSEDKIRRARRKIQALGWLDVKPGFKSRGKGVATRYLSVKWATPEEGEFFAQFHRYSLTVMLSKIRNKTFNHADIVVYIYLSYLHWKNRGKKNGDFFITKAQLRKIADVPDAPARVGRLHSGFTFSGGSHLFEYKDEYQKLSFSGWSGFADPGTDENNRKCAENYLKEIEVATAEAKRKRQMVEQQIEPGDLPGFYEQVSGDGYRLGHNQRSDLIKLGQQYGVARIQKKIITFLSITKHNRTFPYFLSWFKSNL